MCVLLRMRNGRELNILQKIVFGRIKNLCSLLLDMEAVRIMCLSEIVLVLLALVVFPCFCLFCFKNICFIYNTFLFPDMDNVTDCLRAITVLLQFKELDRTKYENKFEIKRTNPYQKQGFMIVSPGGSSIFLLNNMSEHLFVCLLFQEH